MIAFIPHWLQQADTDLFLLLNGWNGAGADVVFKWLTYKYSWIPFYIWIIVLLNESFGKRTWILIVAAVLLITCTDQLSTALKNQTKRLRPCHEPTLAGQVHTVDKACGGRYGFVSSHAANTLALSVFLWMLLPRRRKILLPVLLAYVVLNGYSRIYLGAHYPLDVTGGWLLGFLCAILLVSIIRKRVLSTSKHEPGA
jgi:undecaprenyl-diphosphatase